MKLEEWLNYVGDSFHFSRSPDPEELEVGITTNPNDYYFVIYSDPEGDFDKQAKKYVPRTCACICPIKYFEEEGHMWDQHVLGCVNIPGFAEDMECIISPAVNSPTLEPAEMHELLSDIGLKWSKNFADFIEKGSIGTVYFPETK